MTDDHEIQPRPDTPSIEGELTMNDDGPRPWLRAQQAAEQLSISDVVVRLRAALGAKLVAYIASYTTTRVVREWADGTSTPERDNEVRLRTAVQAVSILAERLDPVTISTWFQGMNPILGDESPARFIRNRGPFDANDVLVAARSMLIE